MVGQGEAELESAPVGSGIVARFSSYAAIGLRYWEPRRFIYNGILSVVVLTHFILGWPGSWERLSFDQLLVLFILAVLANVAYCAAYVVDMFVQFSGLDAAWRWGRSLVLTIGTAFAATIAHFFAKGMFGV